MKMTQTPPPGEEAGRLAFYAPLLARALIPSVLITGTAAVVGHVRSVPSSELYRGLPSVFVLLCIFFALSHPETIRRLREGCARSPYLPLILPQALPGLYLFYALPLGLFSSAALLRLVLYVNLPLFVIRAARPKGEPGWHEGLTILLIWLPIEFGLLGPLWPWPPGQSGTFLHVPLAVCLVVFLYVVMRGLDGIGYTLSLTRHDLKVASLCFLALTPPAAATGLITGFLRPALEVPALLPSLARMVGIFLMTGLPEELLFRGILQNLFQRWFSRPLIALGLASLIFGLAHLNDGPSPDIRYFLIATLAGLAYGIAYRWGGTLMAPALTHTLVNTTWALFFRS